MSERIDLEHVWAADKAHFLHPFTDFGEFARKGSTQAIVRAEGAYLIDDQGRRLLDALSGIQCTNIGLGRHEMADAIAAQIKELSYVCNFVDVTNVPATQLAEKVARIAPGSLNHVFFSTGGSMAVESAYRLIGFYQNIRGKPNKKHVISLINSYHGSTFLTMSLGGKLSERGHCDYLGENIHHVKCPNLFHEGRGLSESGFLKQLERELRSCISEVGADNVAAFFLEPVLGAGGSIVPPAGYHKMVRHICTEFDILLVADEVVTGFGRLGHWFASEDLFGIQPDIITAAKGVTSAYLPLGLTLVSEKIYDACQSSGSYFNHGFTYSGHPACCAAALKNIEILERENLLENVRETGAYFEKRIRELQVLPIVGDVRGIRFLQGVEFVADKTTNTPFDESDNVADRVARACRSHGLNLRCLPPATVIMAPPLILGTADIDFIVDTLGEACNKVAAELGIAA